VLRVLIQASGDSLEEISWDDFFEKLEEEKLAFLYQDETKQGKKAGLASACARASKEPYSPAAPSGIQRKVRIVHAWSTDQR